MRLTTYFFAIMAVLGLFACVGPSTANADIVPQIYWTDITPGTSGSGSIMRANADGTGVQTLVSGLSHPRGMAVDVAGGEMYWAEPGRLAVRRADLDGNNVQTVIPDGQNGTSGVALDTTNGKMYWTGWTTPWGGPGADIRQANLDGSGSQELVTVGLARPVGIAVDTLHGKMYWTDLDGNYDGTGEIRRANLDGSNVETLLTGVSVDEVNGIALDVSGDRMYWPEIATHKIYSAHLDGSVVTPLVEGLENPTTIALDLLAGKMYWTNGWDGGSNNMIQRANLNGTGVETFLSGVGLPWGIAITPEPATLLLLTLGGLMVLRRR